MTKKKKAKNVNRFGVVDQLKPKTFQFISLSDVISLI